MIRYAFSFGDPYSVLLDPAPFANNWIVALPSSTSIPIGIRQQRNCTIAGVYLFRSIKKPLVC